MSSAQQAPLKNFKPKHSFLIGIDSDGCVFDTMELKHKECFIPNIIKYWGLQSVSKYAREAAEFVNLYSKWRGINRFPALVMVFDLLRERPEVKKRKVPIPVVSSLNTYINSSTSLSNSALKTYLEKNNDETLQQVLKWSEAVNHDIAEMVVGVPPFPFVKKSLERLHIVADIIVISATPTEALQREWEEHDIANYTAVIAGQEIGSKKELIQLASAGRYEKNHVLVVGDAPGDLKAAKANYALFYPINPGQEEQSWERFYKEVLEKFISVKYAGSYEDKLIEEFQKLLPATPPWFN
ncbi:MAG: HAD family hydrolase [bacterium]